MDVHVGEFKTKRATDALDFDCMTQLNLNFF